MTTTAREDRKPGPHAGAPDTGPPITPPPKLRRRPASRRRRGGRHRARLPARRVGLERDDQHRGGPRCDEHDPSRRGDHCRRHPTHPDQRRSGSGTAPGFGVRRDHRSARCARHLRGRADHDRVDDRCADAAGGPVDRRDLADPGAGPGAPDARRRQGPDHRHARRRTATLRPAHRSSPWRRSSTPPSTRPQATPSSTSWCRTPTRACSQPVPRPATSRWSSTQEPSDGDHLPDLGIRLPRRHHHCGRLRVLLAAAGAPRRGRPDRRIRRPRRDSCAARRRTTPG